MAFITFINENGNVSAKVRERLKGQTIAAITKAMDKCNLETIANADKGISIPLGTDRSNGNPIYAHISVVISQHDPSVKTAKSKTKSKSKTKTVDEPLPDIFGANTEEADEGEDE